MEVSRPAVSTLAVAVVSKATAIGGGASRVAEELARLLVESGVPAHHWVLFGTPPDPPHRRYLRGSKWSKLFWSASAAASRACSLPDQFTPEMAYVWLRRDLDYTLYHFHDISSAVSPLGMRWIARRRPVVWTFHDCSPFTGGCLYPFGCDRFHTRCGDCPQLAAWPLGVRRDRTGWMQDVKRRTAEAGLIVPVAPSRWMAGEAMSSGMFSELPVVIPYPIDLDVFRPLEKPLVRKILGLPPDAFLVLVSAGNLLDPRKGTIHALEALQQFRRPAEILFVGSGTASLGAGLVDRKVHHAGYVSDPRLLAMYYAAADAMLFPSLADNLPNTIAETMATGTPALAFRVGGVTEMIEHGTTGWLAEARDAAALARGLELVHDDRELLRRWAVAGREAAVARYHPALFLRMHLDLYEAVITGDRKPARVPLP